jgi:hypothetical protein
MNYNNKLGILILICVMLNNCGYSPIYSSKNIELSINSIEFEKNKLNNKIVKILKSLSNDNIDLKSDVKIETIKSKNVLSRSKTGNPEILELTIQLNIEINNNKYEIEQSQNYKNIENKFELNQQEDLIENNLIEKIISKLINNLIVS